MNEHRQETKTPGQVSNQKFQYKRDSTDWGIIFVVLFTSALFGMIFFGGNYFKNYKEVRTPDNKSQIQQLIDNEKALEEELRNYEQDTDFNQNY